MPEKTKDLPGQRAFCAFVDGVPTCLLLADEFLMPSEVRQRYVEHAGFEGQNVGVYCFGPNVLEMDRDGAPDRVWKPITSAPQDGTIVDLIECGERAANCHYNDALKRWERFWINKNGGMSWVEVIRPTHWMAIQPPPNK